MKDQLAKYAGIQTASEVGLGSIFHALHIPFTGHLLSLNQALVLTLAAGKVKHRRAAVSLTSGVSGGAALLKTLSPAGKVLTPMLAISMQGVLFAFGITIGGLNYFGIIIGSILLSMWSFLQPLFIAYFLFGKTLFQAVEALLPTWGWWLLLAGVFVKLAAGIFIACFVWSRGLQFEEKYLKQVDGWWEKAQGLGMQKRIHQNAFLGAVYDLLTPWFLVSLILSIGFFSLQGKNIELCLYGVRCLALGFLFFLFMRVLTGLLKRWRFVNDLALAITRRQY